MINATLDTMLGLLRAGQLAVLRNRAERVLWVLADHCPDGLGQVSMAVIEAGTGMDRRSVRRALRDLEHMGWVRARSRYLGDAVLWSLCLPNCHPPLSPPGKSPHSRVDGTDAPHSSPPDRPGPDRRGGRKPAGRVRV